MIFGILDSVPSTWFFTACGLILFVVGVSERVVEWWHS